MGPKTTVLCDELREAYDLLKNDNEPYWAEFIDTVLWRLERSDFSGIELLLSAYRGGMGSFNDIVLGPPEGTSWSSPEHRALCDRFDALRSSMSELAREIRRDAVVIESPRKKG